MNEKKGESLELGDGRTVRYIGLVLVNTVLVRKTNLPVILSRRRDW